MFECYLRVTAPPGTSTRVFGIMGKEKNPLDGVLRLKEILTSVLYTLAGLETVVAAF